ncbi:MAG TPA: endonuclease/exonuclease/phosphatase family protein [Bacillales bacterium]|nr:endonuclease/exonuclease/phosphatase family protein [Bacillales bacterium]
MVKLSVMTFNLRVDIAEDGENAWPNRVEKVAEVVKSSDPCIIGTQEGLISMISDLQSDLPGYRVIGEGRAGGKEDEHCAIFYKEKEVECVNQGQFWLSETPEKANSVSWESACPRICTWGEFRSLSEPSRHFVVYNTHLDHVSQQAREQGIQLILEKIRGRSNKEAPVILMGDMNAGPDNKAIRMIRDSHTVEDVSLNFTDVYSILQNPPGATFHDFTGNKEGQPIDYIFVSSNATVLEAEVNRCEINGGYPSDHYPLTAQFMIL